ncbi:MAG: hypothetical protein ABSA27_06420 [Terriglobales bacterium]|jgi:hypothetical protein
MQRSVGVTVIVILSLLGSAFTFAMGILMLVVMIMAPVSRSNPLPASPTFFKVMLLLASLVYLLPAVWGIVTGIGLWRLKNWARISIIVFSFLLILMGAFSGLMTLVVPIPISPNNTLDPSVMTGIRISMGAFMLALAGIGVWWLVFFNRPKVKEQFGQLSPALADRSTLPATYPGQTVPVGTADPSAGKRPLSITILAWLLLAGCLVIPFSLMLRVPAILFTKLLTGWPAVLFYLSFAVVQLCIGVGLLRLRPTARTAAIIYYALMSVNAAVFYLAPGSHARVLSLMESERSMFPGIGMFPNQPEFHFDAAPFLVMGGVCMLIGTAIPLYFLITRKVAFEKAAAALGSGVSQG